MNKLKIVLSVACVVSSAVFAGSDSIEYPYSFKMEGNPLVRHISSTDPDANVWDGVVWVYASQDHPKPPGETKGYAVMDGYHAFSSKDLINWTDHGEVIHSRDLSWGKDGWMWAPGAARKNGKYYLYYPHRDKTDTWRIGVAVGDTPAGPFKDIGQPMEGITGIDPKIFIDDDGEAYIYNNSAIIAKLKPSMIELAEEPRKIDYAPLEVRQDKLLKFNEGAYMIKRNGKYYFSYTNWHNKEHHGFYAIGDNPYGPFEWKGAFAPQPAGAQFHHSIIEFNNQWYCFYHIATPKKIRDEIGPSAKGFQRRITCFDRLYFNEDGSIKMLEYTRDWVPGETE